MKKRKLVDIKVRHYSEVNSDFVDHLMSSGSFGWSTIHLKGAKISRLDPKKIKLSEVTEETKEMTTSKTVVVNT